MRAAAMAAAIILAAIVSSASALSAVSVVYFVPSDQEPNQEFVAQIDGIMADVQGWYGAQVGSTFDVGGAILVKGKKTAAQYDDIWLDILRELDYRCGTGVHVIFVHPSIAFTGGGACSDGEGTAMITEALFEGVVAHELGHAFALPHSTCGSVMFCWWNYPNVGLLDVEIQALQASPYFGSEPTPKSCEPKYNPHGKRVGRCRA